MKVVVLMLLILLFIYLGNVIVGYIICESIESVSIAKRYIFVMPILVVSFVLYIISGDKGNKLRRILGFILLPSKMLLICCAISDSMKCEHRITAESHEKQPIKYTVIRNGLALFDKNFFCYQAC